MNEPVFIDQLRDELEKTTNLKENSSHFIIHCPNCEALRDKNKVGHLYISKIKDGCPGKCQKCDLSFSKIHIDLLSKIGIINSDVIRYVKENFKIKRSHIVNLDERDRKLDYIVPTDTQNRDKFKINKLSDRLIYDIDNESDIKTYRIVTNLSRFISENHIDMSLFNEKELSMIPMIDNYYIGFLSYYGNVINFRNMGDTDNYPRYLTFNVNKEIRRSFFYTPVSLIDPLSENPKITIAEGPIDIISIHISNKGLDENNNIYAAASSAGSFRAAIKNCLYISGYFGANIHMYLDNDAGVTKISQYNFDQTVHSLRDFSRDFKVKAFVNLSGKDFGDMREKITIASCDLTRLISS